MVAASSWADPYQLGQGMQVGDFLLSGYGNLVAEAPNGQPARLVVDDLSLYVNGSINRWLNPFLEAEISGANLLHEGGADNSAGRLVLERFYDDVHLSETNTLRLGKILSPVGDWNLIHAAPLVPTITRPLTTYRGFAEYASGLSWLHESDYSGVSPDWQIYWQPDKELVQRPDSVSPRHHRDVFGAHLNWSFGMLDNAGLSYQQGEQLVTGQRYTLGGLNARKVVGRLTLQGEATTAYWSAEPAGGRSHEWGAFLVADYRFTPYWHGIVEREVYQPHGTDAQSRSNLLGVAYKPNPAVVWKLEYVHQQDRSREVPSGWSASCAVLF
ncbi:MAG TPA: hypothetical protein VF811_11625 [Parasulfuritortus sp.]